MIDFSSPLAGLERAAATVDQTAKRLAGRTTPPPNRTQSSQAPQQQEDKVELSSEIVALIGARNSFQANAQAFRVEDDLSKSTISLLA